MDGIIVEYLARTKGEFGRNRTGLGQVGCVESVETNGGARKDARVSTEAE